MTGIASDPRNRSAMLSRILQQMEQTQQYQPQSWGALAAGLGTVALQKRALEKELEKQEQEKRAKGQALGQVLGGQPVGGGPTMDRANPGAQLAYLNSTGAAELPIGGAVAEQLLGQLFPEQRKPQYQEVGNTLLELPSVSGEAPRVAYRGEDTRQMGTKDLARPDGMWQTYATRPDGNVDMNRPLGSPFRKRPEAADVSTNIQDDAFGKALGGVQGDIVKASYTAASDSAQIIETVHEGRRLLEGGIISGFGAETIVAFGQALRQVGFDVGEDAISNTQAYSATLAQNVAKLIKQFGSGTGLSDADREYAQKMAGGEIKLEEASLKKILDISDRAARTVINKHNKLIKGKDTVIDMAIEIPQFDDVFSQADRILQGTD